jgi:hypothetical protein
MIRKFVLGGLIAPIFLFMVSFGFASDFKDSIPKQEILVLKDGEAVAIKDSFPVGEIVELIVPKIKVNPDNLVSTNYNWKIFEIKYDKEGKEYRLFRKNYRGLTDNPIGPSVLFSTGNKSTKFYVEVLATYVFCTKKDEKTVDISTYTKILENSVKIVSDNPEPNPPDPVNPDVPTPSFPDGKFKISKSVYEAAMKNIPAVNREKGAIASSNAYKSVASAIAAGAISKIEDALAKCKDANITNLKNVGINSSSSEWQAFGFAIQTSIYDLYDKGQVNTVQDIRDLFLEISVGLEKVK